MYKAERAKRAAVLERSGMERKIEEIIDTYGNLLYRTGMMMLGEPQDVQDVLQEVMLTWFRKSPCFHDSEHEKAWLLCVTMNQCRDMLRFRRRHQYLRIEELDVEYDDTADAQGRELLAEIAALPPKWRSVLLLHYVEGYSLREIADILAISENAVKKRMQRAKAALKKRMEET